MHDAGVELNDTFFIGQPAVAHGIILGVVFNNGDGSDNRVERVATALEDVHAFAEGLHSIGG